MKTEDHWSVEIYLDEDEGQTHAEARLVARDREKVRGRGQARCNPTDWDVPEIGAELATSRALSDLAHRLLDRAAEDIEAVTHEHVTLNR